MGREVIRTATESDLPEIMRMGRAFLACTDFSHVPFDESAATQLVMGLLNGTGTVIVSDCPAGLNGMVAMVAFPHFFNANVKAAQEFFWWVDAPARGTRIAIRLLNQAEEWAHAQGCSTVHMLALDALNGAQVASMYERRGYVSLERTFMRTL